MMPVLGSNGSGIEFTATDKTQKTRKNYVQSDLLSAFPHWPLLGSGDRSTHQAPPPEPQWVEL